MKEPPTQLLRRPSIIDQHLATLLQTVSIEVEAGSELLTDGIVERLAELLSSDRAEQAAEIIAEMAKSEDNRIIMVQQAVIPPLVGMVHNSQPRALRQACRAIGNMCFESQTGRDIVLSEGGVNALVTRLSELRPSEETVKSQNEVHYMLCGSLHTICMDHEEVQKEAIKLKTLPILIDYLKHSTDGTVLRFVLNIIAAFLDHGEEITEAAIELNLAPIASEILKTQKDDETVKEAVLDVLGNFNFLEKPLIQMQLYQSGVLSQIVDIINTSLDETDADAIERIASEILVLVVSHDGIAQLVFEDKALDLTKEAMDWMKGYQEHLKGTGALVIGNLATSDLRSSALVETPDLVETLFKVLDCDYSSDEMLVKVKHAALSALRNLSICESAKPRIRPYLPTLLTYVTSDLPMLVYKSVGCVRCLTRGNSDIATELAHNISLVQGLVGNVEKYKYHNGIQGEVPRLISTLIVEGKPDSNNLSQMLDCKIMPLILQMTTTKEFPQIQVEGWLAVQKVIHTLGDGSSLLSENILKFCEGSLADDTNPNVRILALNIIRLLSSSLTKEEDLHEITEHLNRLSVSATDLPAQQLASEIKQSKPFN
ncbi:hypothetical protein ACHWQZ_G010480 [Mnemiopsis leidyi]